MVRYTPNLSPNRLPISGFFPDYPCVQDVCRGMRQYVNQEVSLYVRHTARYQVEHQARSLRVHLYEKSDLKVMED